MKKKLLAIILVLALALTACTGEGNKTEGTDGKKLKIGILQFMEHPSLDQAREGFIKELKNLGVDAEIDYKNSQGKIEVGQTIVEKFVSDKVDLIYAIATPSAQTAQAATKDIPVLFSAVTDPVDAKLVATNETPGANVTGVSDMVDIKDQLEIFKQLNPEISTIGLIYSADENNSLQQVKVVEESVKELGLGLKTISIQNLSDIPQAVTSIAKDIQGLYLLTDNKVSSSSSLVNSKMIEEKIPVVASVEADVEQGALITLGINYLDQGKYAAEMAKKVLLDKEEAGKIPVKFEDEKSKIINSKTLEALGLDSGLEILKDAKDIGK